MVKNRAIKYISLVIVLLNITSIFFVNCSGQGFESLASVSSDDPFYDKAWHLKNTGQSVYASKAGKAGVDMNLQQTWAQGLFGSGIKILISDTGVEDNHEDLHGNFSYNGGSKDYTLPFPYVATSSAPKTDGDNHGTSVAGVAAAIAFNGKGSRGVAPKASITSANLISEAVTLDSYAKIIDQLDGTFDISNMSWGATQNLVDDDLDGHNTDFENALKILVANKRNGKGAIFVKAAGNDFIVGCYGDEASQCVGNSNFDRDNTTPYMIIVAALNALGGSADYSSPGSNLWISSFGGMFATDTPAIMTTDRMGCSLGEASTKQSSLSFDRGADGNSQCNYTVSFNGTSSASPSIAGAVALMLEANKNLTWRDIKYILAKTARTGSNTNSIDHPLQSIHPMPTGYVWEQGWVTNTAGFKFHNWYGFGVVNVDAAVAMAKSYTSALGSYHETTWFDSNTIDLSVPDNSATGASSTLTTTDSVKIESVRIKIKVTHPDISQLGVELTSPTGTKSIIINAANSLTNIPDYTGREIFLSNAFLGENSAGDWTLKVVDAVSGKTGTVNSWSINFVGGQ